MIIIQMTIEDGQPTKVVQQNLKPSLQELERVDEIRDTHAMVVNNRGGKFTHVHYDTSTE